MEGNPICVQIPWDKNPEALAKWAEGRTGFPWIDAIMTQLRQEGWIHHLARHAVACFLTRGDLWISWEEGMKVSVLPTNGAWLYFEELYIFFYTLYLFSIPYTLYIYTLYIYGVASLQHHSFLVLLCNVMHTTFCDIIFWVYIRGLKYVYLPIYIINFPFPKTISDPMVSYISIS